MVVECFGVVFPHLQAERWIRSSVQLHDTNDTFDGVGTGRGLRLVSPGQGEIASTSRGVVDLNASMVSLPDVVLSPLHLK